jgi:hypothetical protein
VAVGRGLESHASVLARVVLAAAVAASALFSSFEPLPLELKAPFNDLFEHARTDETYAVTGTLTYRDGGRPVTIDNVKITLRGNTSRNESECTFPKLKLQLPDEARAAAALFDGMRSVKIGTHCGEAPDEAVTIKYGRLPNEHSPIREVFVYRLLDALGVPALKARAATITYVYTDPQSGQTPPQDQPLVRRALVLEDESAGVARLGGTREIPEKEFTNARAQFAPPDTVRLAFAEALIGNFDWCLKMTPDDTYRCDARHPLWNIVAAATDGGKARPIMYDFDVSGIVTGHHPWFKDVFNAAFSPAKSPIDTEVLAQVQRTRSLFSRAELDAARAEFVKRKGDAYRTLEQSGLDAGGRKIAQQYVDAFYRAIDSDDAFYRPVVVAPNTRLFVNENRQAACGTAGTVPVGTPVSEPLQKSGTLVQVWLLDALWRWAAPVKCAAVHQHPMWIEAAAIGRDYPAK